MALDIYSLSDAAAYLTAQGVPTSTHTLRYHLYKVKDLVPDAKKGHTILFTRATLDAFATVRRAVGRPAKPR